jgi:hypothetical protein
MEIVPPISKHRGKNSSLFIRVKIAILLPKKNTGIQGFLPPGINMKKPTGLVHRYFE